MKTNTTKSKVHACSACQHWSNEASSEKGECRRHAPQAFVFTIDSKTKFESRFPVTNASDWCGEFQAESK
ncbi:MAG: hypothetical protein HC845_08885 [Akkermansiaceae bacterium]|nr:hypothetical protein [Akkermansiaceae bacterium]